MMQSVTIWKLSKRNAKVAWVAIVRAHLIYEGYHTCHDAERTGKMQTPVMALNLSSSDSIHHDDTCGNTSNFDESVTQLHRRSLHASVRRWYADQERMQARNHQKQLDQRKQMQKIISAKKHLHYANT